MLHTLLLSPFIAESIAPSRLRHPRFSDLYLSLSILCLLIYWVGRSGLSIDSDLITASGVSQSFSGREKHIKTTDLSCVMDAITTSTTASPPSTLQFPVNINSTRDHHDHDTSHDHDHDHGDTGPSPCDNRRAVVDEMDFFSDRIGRHDAEHNITNMDDLKNPQSPLRLRLNDVDTCLNLLTTNTSSDQSMIDDGISSNMEDKRAKTELVALQAELGRIKEENLRLRGMLNQVTGDFTAFQKHIVTLAQDQQKNNLQINEVHEGQKHKNSGGVLRQFVGLGLANGNGGDQTDDISLSTSEVRSCDRSISSASNNNNNSNSNAENEDTIMFEQDKKGGLDSAPREKEGSSGPSKVARYDWSKNDDQTEAAIRKARVSVRARSEDAMISDGCQWRKYGQKKAKGNPCPRAYYRCTMAVGCPVRKQVQRCAEDQTILITTYEGNHNHPLPPAAVAMASTTSSAARMLLSGSTSSADGLMNSNFLSRTLFPCSSSLATISDSAPFPTVTLDLTQNNNNALQLQRQQTQMPVPFPNLPQNFANAPAAAALLPQIFGQALYNQSKFSGLQMSQDMETNGLSHQSQPGQQNAMADTVSAATAAIAADPNFTAVLAAAITSIIGGGHPNNNVTATSNSNGNITTSNSNSNGNNKMSSKFSGK